MKNHHTWLACCALFAVAWAGCSKEGLLAVPCYAPDLQCGQYCIDVSSDPANCGACGKTCQQGFVCAGGACICGYAEMACGSKCVNPDTDNENCGTCGNACPAGTACSAGACAETCSPGRSACPTAAPVYCADLQNDPGDCGACGNVCVAGQLCQAGQCTETCSAGATACPSDSPTYCALLPIDANNCGACGHLCPTGSLCASGSCVETCTQGFAACPATAPTYCAALDEDTNNCGSCGKICDRGEVCSDGRCACPANQPDECNAGTIEAYCTDQKTDPANCGSCGNTCSFGQSCDAGACACSAAQPDQCGSDDTAFCTSLADDPANCGSCGHSCLGGLCADGGCRPVVISEENDSVLDSAESAAALYWTAAQPISGAGEIMEVPTAGDPAPSTLFSEAFPGGVGVPLEIVLNATDAYLGGYVSGNTYPLCVLQRVPLDGGAPTMLYTAPDSFLSGLAVDNDNVYWSTVPSNGADGGFVFSMPLDGGTQTVISAASSAPAALVLSQGVLFWRSMVDTSIMMAAADGSSPPQVLAANQPLETNAPSLFGISFFYALHSIAADADHVYWTTFNANVPNGQTQGAVLAGPFDGGTPTVLASSQTEPTAIAVDSTRIYWWSASGNVLQGELLDGGSLVTLSTNYHPAGDAFGSICSDSTAVYWTQAWNFSPYFSPRSSGSSRVWKLAK